MDSIETLSLMTEAVFNYIRNINLNQTIEIKNQFDDCLQKLEVLKEIASRTELKRAA